MSDAAENTAAMPPMARRKLLTDVFKAFTQAGAPPTAARICANGDVLLLTQNPPAALDSPDSDADWVDLAGKA